MLDTLNGEVTNAKRKLLRANPRGQSSFFHRFPLSVFFLLLLSSFAHIFCFISVILKNWIDLFGSIRNDIISLRYWIHEWNCESMCRTNKCAAVKLTYSRHKIKKEIYSEGVVDHSFVFLAKKIAYKTNRRDSPSRQLIVESTDGRYNSIAVTLSGINRWLAAMHKTSMRSSIMWHVMRYCPKTTLAKEKLKLQG